MAYKSIDDIGTRQLRNRLNRLREHLNDNALHPNIGAENLNEAQ